MPIDITQHGQSCSDEELADRVQKLNAAIFEKGPHDSSAVPHPTVPVTNAGAGVGNILHSVKEIWHTTQAEQVNKLLNEGWLLIGVREGVERTGEHEFSPYFRYSMGRVR